MSDDVKSYENLQRRAFRQVVHRVWAMIQAGLTDEMNEAEARMARILIEHPEYEEIFDDEEVLDGDEFDTGREGNPFVHVSLHKMVEDQLEAGRPEEVLGFLDAMKAQGHDPHEIVHAIMKILVRLIADSVTKGKSFDGQRYRRLLERLRGVRLDEADDALDREFMGH